MRRTLRLVLLMAGLGVPPGAAEPLPRTVVPNHYDLDFTIDLKRERFSGVESIQVRVAEPTTRIVLHALDLELRDVVVAAGNSTQKASVSFDREAQTATLAVGRPVPAGA